jgi:ATP-dependent DNA ligase
MRKEDFMLCQKITEEESNKLNNDIYKANIKYDGERIATQIDYINNEYKPVLLNRRGNICNFNFKEVVEELKKINKECVLDGEIISVDDNFTKLQKRALTKNISKLNELEKTIPVKFMIFDILSINGRNIMNEPLHIRLNYLNNLFQGLNFKHIELAEYGNIKEMFNKAKEQKREGIVIKNINANYESRRSNNWLKLKFWLEEDIIFQKYTYNPMGIRVETNDEIIACQVAGSQSKEIAELIDKNGEVELTIQYLSKNKDTGSLRFPSYKKIVIKDNNQGII